ncbi:MAG: hypothetical protein AAGD14_06605 [Planctomycetota bacterium]
MTDLRPLEARELARIPGLHLLTHVGPLRTTEDGGGTRHEAEGIVHVAPDCPLARGRSEFSHVIFLEASNNLSHWITHQVPAVADRVFKVATAFPRGMGLPPVSLGTDVRVRGEVYFQKNGDRWRGETTVRFYRPDGTLAETVNFPLIERTAAPG